MRGLLRDVRFGFRALLSKPGFTAAALASLVLGIGSVTAIFTLLDAIFWHPLPSVHEARELVAVFQTLRQPSGEATGFRNLSYPNFLDDRERSRTVTLVAFQWAPLSLAGGREPERARGMFASADYFDVLGVTPWAGRFFGPADDQPASAPVAVLSHGCWNRVFGADPGAVGKTVTINGQAFTVIGIAPPGFKGTEIEVNVDFWMPLRRFGEISPWAQYFETRSAGLFKAIGRLRPGSSAEQAGAELQAIATQLETDYPEDNERLGLRVRPLLASLAAPERLGEYVDYGAKLSVAVALILVIACINVANLLLVRGFERGREMAVRMALGAPRRRLVRQLLTENLLLFLAGSLVSLPLAHWSLALFWRFRPPRFEADALDLSFDAGVWGFAVAVALAFGLLFGLVPALRASKPDLAVRLKESDALPVRGSGRRWWRPRQVLVTVQVALALVALVAAGLFLRNLQNAYRVDLGYVVDGMVVVTLAPGDQGYDAARGRDFYRRLLERVRALPEVEAAGLSENRLLRGAVVSHEVFLPGHTEASVIGARDLHRTNVVSPGFFDAVGIGLEAGRDFTDAEPADGPRVAIVNHTMAETLWPGERAVGQRFHFDFPDTPPLEVVGVVHDAKYRKVFEDPQFFVYLPLAQAFAGAMALHVRTALEPSALLPVLRREVRELDPALPLDQLSTMGSYVDGELWLERAVTTLLAVFGALALALASVGVYGVLAFSVSRRRKEFGVRLALGARRGDVLREVLLEAATLVGGGLAIGLVVAFFVLRPWLASRLYGVEAGDPLIYLAFSGVLLAVALAGCVVPAWRASRTEPVKTLRSE